MCQPSANINEVPYEETQEVLDNVETLIKDADGKFEDPNIDLSILPPEINSDGTLVIGKDNYQFKISPLDGTYLKIS